MIVCHNCKKQNSNDSNFCIYCGTKLIKRNSALEKIKTNESRAKKLRYGTEIERSKAIRLYEENITYNTYCESYSDLISLYMEKQEYEKAIDVAKKGIRIYSDNGKSTDLLEMMLENSEMSYHIKISADNNIHGKKLEKEGKIDEAIEAYESNVLIHAETPHTYARLSIIYRKRKEIDNEIRVLKQGIKNCRKNPNKSHVDRFKKALEKAKIKKAKIKSERLPQADKNHRQRDKQANELLKESNANEAIKLLELNISEKTISNNTYAKLIKTYVELEQYGDAERICKQAIEVYKPLNSAKVSRYRQKLLKIHDLKVKYMRS